MLNTTFSPAAIRLLLFWGMLCTFIAQLSAQQPSNAVSTSTPQPPKQGAKTTVYMVSNAHLDTQWNWDIQTTIRDYIRHTLYQNLDLIKTMPNYIFNFEGAIKYHWMKEYYPERWEELCQRVKEGRWHLTGSGWDACEAIISSPESWLRNTCLGQTFYRQEFDRECSDVFLPDCFGFPYTLPTLASHCGLIGFSSQKLQWRTSDFYGKGKKYPFSIGLWEGIDGSKIMMAHGWNYSQAWKNEDLTQNESLRDICAQSPLGIAYRYYGTGDRGGSPDYVSAKTVCEAAEKQNPNMKIICATSDQLYKDFLPYEQHSELPTFKGELTMDVHGNGCYTSQAAMKFYNRQNEHLGDAAERAAVITDWAGMGVYPYQQLRDTWRRVIWHQFHDDLTGTSIPRAYEFSWNDELLALKSFSDVLTTAASSFSSQLDTRVNGTPVVVYNAEAFEVTSYAQLDVVDDSKTYCVRDSKGKRVPAQVVWDSNGKAHLLFEARVPATGYAVFAVTVSGHTSPILQGKAKEGAQTIENERYTLTLNQQGDISSLTDKQSQRQLLADGKALRLIVLNQCESIKYPAWEIQKFTIESAPRELSENVKIKKIEQGPLRTTVKISKNYGKSIINEYITLWHGELSERIDFYNEVEWKSSNALLKAEFPLAANNEKASYDLGLGMIQRGNNCDQSFEVYSHEWSDLTDKSGDFGVTILNDSRYGWDKPNDHTLRLSLLYTPKTAKRYSYQNQQDFGHHTFTYSLVAHNGELNLAQTTRRAATLNSPLKAIIAPVHDGKLGKRFSFVNADNENVFVRCLKRAETSDEYIVRVYELSGKSPQQATLTFAGNITHADVADGTEKVICQADYKHNTLSVEVKPFGIATYRIRLQSLEHKKGDEGRLPQEEVLALPYDKMSATINHFPAATDFADGYSYAAELLPENDTLLSGGITFKLGNRFGNNALICHGNSIHLPMGCSKLYLLAASTDKDRKVTFQIGNTQQERSIPYYTGFIGQWGHDGHTVGYLKEAEVAYVGSHRHSSDGDEPYEFTYMYRIALDVPQGTTQVTLPHDEHIVLFAATAVFPQGTQKQARNIQLRPSRHFKTSNRCDSPIESEEGNEVNVMKHAKIQKASGYARLTESPEYLIDGKEDTKWCDVGDGPHWVEFDLGDEEVVSRWALLSAGAEKQEYITRGCLLMGKQGREDEWGILDQFDGNHKNKVNRTFAPQPVRFLRLLVVSPLQLAGAKGSTRIYELEVFRSNSDPR